MYKLTKRFNEIVDKCMIIVEATKTLAKKYPCQANESFSEGYEKATVEILHMIRMAIADSLLEEVEKLNRPYKNT